MNDNEIKIIDSIRAQAEHIMRMYESHELKEMMINLAREWYCKGVHVGLQHARDERERLTKGESVQ